MELTGRAKTYAVALSQLSRRKGISGRGTLVDRGARHLSLGVRLNNELQINDAIGLAEPLALATNTRVVVAKREAGLVIFQFELARHYWEKYTRTDLRMVPGMVGLGFGDGHRQVNFQFTHAAPHTGVFGTTGSGKSETVKSLLCGLFTAYRPDELGVIIIDPDGDYVHDFRNVAHLEYPIARRGTEIDYVLSRAYLELRERRRSDDPHRYSKRLVVLIDEAEDVLSDEKRLRATLSITKRGRKRNMNLIAATQKPTQRTLPDLMPEILNRYVGLVSDGRVSAYLTGQAGLECHKLTGEGDFIHVSRQDRLLVAMATRTDYDHLPRTEISWGDTRVQLEPDDDSEPEEDERKPGRPKSPIDPKKIAYYMHQGHPGHVSIAHARQHLGLARYAHYEHRDFAQELITELLKLRELMKGTT
jgi:hypothetical protein